jgi:hypothetical protein
MRRLGLLALAAAGVGLIAWGLCRWRAESAAKAVAEEFLAALLDGDTDALTDTLTLGLANRLLTADPTLKATFSVPAPGATAGVQRVRVAGRTATVRAVVRGGREQIIFDLELTRDDELGWKVAGVIPCTPSPQTDAETTDQERRATTALP